MSVSLETEATEQGIICSFPVGMMAAGAKVRHEMAGKAFGRIVYVPTESYRMWEARPMTQMPEKAFLSLEAAQFYMLAAAAEYIAVTA